MALTHLLKPLQIGKVEIKNRIARAAHGTYLGKGQVTEDLIAYYEARGRSGVGLSIIEPVVVHPSSMVPTLQGYSDDAIPGLRQLAEASHRHGMTVFSQIWHRGHRWPGMGGAPGISASSVPCPRGSGSVAFAMTSDLIGEIIEAFAKTALRGQESVVDGVEIHCGHAYLIQQFLSPATNLREDEWGEPLTFTKSLIAAVRAAIAPEKMIGFRMAAEDEHPPEAGGLSLDRLCELARDIADTGEVDFLNTSIGAYSPDYAAVAVATYRQAPGHELHLTTRIRDAVGGKVPVIGVGRITTPDLAQKALTDGVCKLVGMARALTSDAALPEKSRAGASSSIRRRVGANDCVDRKLGGINIACFHNPDVGREAVAAIAPASRKKRILIVGPGPAGLKAAEVSALRGHEVILVERSSKAGGALRHLRGTRAGSLVHATDWLVSRLAHHQVAIRFGIEADTDLIAETKADHVIFATGASRPVDSAFPGASRARVMSSIDALGSLVKGRVLVLDRLGDKEAAQVAEAAIARGCSVEFVTPFDCVAPRAGYTHHKAIGLAFRSGDVKVHTEMDFAEFENGQVLLKDVDSRDHLVGGRPDRRRHRACSQSRARWPDEST